MVARMTGLVHLYPIGIAGYGAGVGDVMARLGLLDILSDRC